MQVNNINTTQSFGTRCIIGKTSAQEGLKNCGENITKGIYKAFKKLSENEAQDTFAVTLGKLKADNPDTYMKFSYFDANKNLKSSVNFNIKTLKTYTEKVFSSLISGTYSMLKDSTYKAMDIEKLCTKTAPDTSKRNITAINKLAQEFGVDEII